MVNGIIKWYDDDSKRGVIAPNGGANDVMFNQDVVEGGVKLVKGDGVEFTAVDGKATWVCKKTQP